MYRRLSLLVVLASMATTACNASPSASATPNPAAATASPQRLDAASTAIFAGGCFWCTESDFEKLPGVLSAESGYIGGQEANPSYEAVSARQTGHTEAVLVRFDPAKVRYEDWLEYFWKIIDPTVADAQFCDRGPQYRSGIFPLDAQQMAAASASKKALETSGRFAKIYTEVTAAGQFWAAEEYHQDYYKKNSLRYKYYRSGCGRDARLKQLWGEKP